MEQSSFLFIVFRLQFYYSIITKSLQKRHFGRVKSKRFCFIKKAAILKIVFRYFMYNFKRKDTSNLIHFIVNKLIIRGRINWHVEHDLCTY